MEVAWLHIFFQMLSLHFSNVVHKYTSIILLNIILSKKPIFYYL